MSDGQLIFWGVVVVAAIAVVWLLNRKKKPKD